MAEGGFKITDLAGVQPLADAAKIATQSVVDALGAVFSRICNPAAEEFGLIVKDRFSYWRARNAIAFAEKLEKRLTANKTPETAKAPPRLAMSILQQASWTDDSEVQDLWAGLLASSCTEEGDDDSNLIFINLLGAMTKLQAKILKYSCEKCQKTLHGTGLINTGRLIIETSELISIIGESDIQRLDRELDHLTSLSLLDGGGFSVHNNKTVNITPSPLALHMYVRCQGSRLSPSEFYTFDLRLQPPIPPAPA